MKLLKSIMAVVMFLMLSGCPKMNPRYLPQPKAVDAAGLYTHKQSGMVFPKTVDDFRRVSVLNYDTEGLHMSAGYDLFDPPRAIAATVYIYPAPRVLSFGSPAKVVASARATLCQSEFEGRKQEILQAHPGAKLIEERDVSLVQSGATYSGKMAAFEYDDVFAHKHQAVGGCFYLFCYVGEKWVVKYRFSHPKDFEATKDIEGFMRNLELTLSTS